MKIIKKLVVIGFSLTPLLAMAVTLDLSQSPLASKSTPVKPNIMLLLDDSGSMDAEDVFYTPGYDFNKRYDCGDNSTILQADSSKTVVMHVERTPTAGVGFFQYGNKYYEINANPAAATVTRSKNIEAKVCFNPDLNYKVRLQTDTCKGEGDPETVPNCRTEEYCSHWRYYWSWYEYRYIRFCPNWAYYDPYRRVCNGTITIPGEEKDLDYCYAGTDVVVEEKTGSFLNWYLSASSNNYYSLTNTRIAARDLSGGLFSNFVPARDFIVPVSDGETGSSRNSPFRSRGYKRNTSNSEERMAVAQDVAFLLASGTADISFGLSSFYNPGDTIGNTGFGAEIDAPISEFGDLKVNTGSESTLIDNRMYVLKRIKALSPLGGTPLSESLAALGGYFSLGGSSKVTYQADNSAPVQSFTAKTLFDNSHTVRADRGESGGFNVPNIYSSSEAALPRVMSQTKWCRKSYIIALTDGEPTVDEGLDNESSALTTWIGTKRSGSDNHSGENLNDVAAALFDLDLRPDIDNADGTDFKNNIKSYMIGFGDKFKNRNSDVYKLLADAAVKGGGLFFSATSGAQLAQAIDIIKQDILGDDQSIASVALSSVSELRQTNLTFKASYESSNWSGSLQSFFINIDGDFEDAVVDGQGNVTGSGSAQSTTTNVTPAWDLADITNKMYVLPKESLYRSIDKRKIYTTDANYGAQPFTYANYNNLPSSIKNDITQLAGASNTERQDLINFIRGDISNEERNPAATNEKYRSRVSVAADNDGKIDSVTNGSIIGSIVHSSPVYLSESPRPWGDQISEKTGDFAYGMRSEDGNVSKLYSDFKKYNEFNEDDTAKRPPMIYFGANDGMLHAITVHGHNTGNDETRYPPGSEVWAYMPSFIAANSQDQGFHDLADRFYKHHYMVDVSPTISEVFWDHDYTGGGSAEPEWRSILASGVGAGGKGFFALDVTCPLPRRIADTGTCSNEAMINPSDISGFAASREKSRVAKNILWEFTQSQDNNMGYTFSNPIVAKVNYDAGKLNDPNGNGNGRWAVIANNGYNSATGKAVLYVLFLDGVSSTAGDNTWVEGEDYLVLHASERGIKTPSSIDVVAGPGVSENANGLSSPSAYDIENDGIIDRIYAGDLKGNMWVFDVSEAASTSNYNNQSSFPWTVNKLVEGRANQAVTTAPRLQVNGDLVGVEPAIMVVYGTGMYLQDEDIIDSSDAFEMQSIYGVLDNGNTEIDPLETVTDGNNVSKTRLEPRYLVDRNITKANGGTAVARRVFDRAGNDTLEGNFIDIDWSVQNGWYIDLYSADENNVTNSAGRDIGERLIYNPLLVKSTFVFSTIIPSNRECSGGLTSWTLAVDWKTGGANSFAVFDVNEDSKLGENPTLSFDDTGYIGVLSAQGAGESSFVDGNLYTTVDNAIKKQKIQTGKALQGGRLGWEEQLPYGIKP